MRIKKLNVREPWETETSVDGFEDYDLTRYLELEGFERRAMHRYRRAIREGDHAKAHVGLARLLILRRRLAEAEYHSRRAFRKSRTAAIASDALTGLGRVMNERGHLRKALDTFRLASRTDRRNPAPLYSGAVALLRDGRVSQGRAWLAHAESRLRHCNDWARSLGYALVHFDLDVTKGAKMLVAALAASPHDPTIWEDVAESYRKRGRAAEAAKAARTARRLWARRQAALAGKPSTYVVFIETSGEWRE